MVMVGTLVGAVATADIITTGVVGIAATAAGEAVILPTATAEATQLTDTAADIQAMATVAMAVDLDAL